MINFIFLITNNKNFNNDNLRQINIVIKYYRHFYNKMSIFLTKLEFV